MFRNTLFQHANTLKNTQTTAALQHSEVVDLMPAMDPVDDNMPSEQKNIGYDPVNKTLYGVPIWKLFIDKPYHFYNDEMCFDNMSCKGEAEPGYNKAMHGAFAYMLTTLNKKLDANEFKKIHHLCVSNVRNMYSNQIEFKPSAYPMSLSVLQSKELLKEWEEEHLIIRHDIGDDDPSFLVKKHLYLASWTILPMINIVEIRSTSEDLSPALIAKKVNQLFDEYYAGIEKAKNDDDKLSLIMSLCRKLAIGHFFEDGNKRTIVFIILNKLLIENNFSPVILDNSLGYLPKRELINSVKIGMQNFLSLIPKVQSTPQLSSSYK